MALALKPSKLLMPKATAVWLIENTKLTFRQIAEFVGLTEIEIEALANEDIGKGLVGRNPLENGELTSEEIARGESNTTVRLKMSRSELPQVKKRARGPRYTPVSKRGDKPDAIAYIIKNNPEIKDSKICRLLGTTKPTISAVRDRTHPNAANIRPRHPAEVGLCTYQEYEILVQKSLKAAGKDPEKIQEERERLLREEEEKKKSEDQGIMSAGFDFSNFLSGAKPQKPAESSEEDQM